MEKKDMHVLNWEQIVSKQNNNNSDYAQSKGILFEDLIENLLREMFPQEHWRRTAQSHDGKRDFVFPFEEYLPEEKWAECKNYKSNLSINVIAPTLIMGTLEKIGIILIFSYSSLNNNAIDSIIRYVKSEHRKVKIYDGNLLESLICKYHNLPNIAKYFANTDFEKAIETLSKRPLRTIISIRNSAGLVINDKHQFRLGEIFYIHSIIQNTSMETFDCSLSVLPSKSSMLNCDTSKKKLSIAGSDIAECILKCDCLSAGTLKCTVQMQHSLEKTEKKISITIVDESYLAWTGENALTIFNSCYNHLLNKSNTPMLITGPSGTGKTRLIDILLSNDKIQSIYQIIKLNLHISRSNCVQDLLFQGIQIIDYDDIPDDQEDDRQVLSMILSNYVENYDKLAETILKIYNAEKPFLFVIDDIQEITSTYLMLLNTLVFQAENKKLSIYFCFSLNEEDLSVQELMHQLNWDEYYQNRQISRYGLKKYDKNDIIIFLKTQYGLQNIDEFFNDYTRTITPLELQNFCLRIKKAQIIKKFFDGSIYYITNRFKFADAVNNILYETIPFMDLCSKIDGARLSMYVLKYIFVVGYASDYLQCICKRQINYFIELGILKESNNKIVFYHDEICKSIEKTLEFLPEDYADIFSDNDTDIFAKAICVLSQMGKIRDGESFLWNFWDQNHGLIRPKQRYDICKLIISQFEKLSEINMISKAISFLVDNIAELSREQGHDNILSFYESIFKASLISHWDVSNHCVENISYLIKKYFDRAISTYKYKDCIYYYSDIKNIFNKLINITNERRYYWLAHYANRIAIVLDRDTVPLAEEPDNVTKQYQLATKLKELAGTPIDLELQDIVDNFNRHYIYRHDLTNTIIKNYLERLKKIDRSKLDRPIILDYHILLIQYLYYHMNRYTSESLYRGLWTEIESTLKECASDFYTLKLMILNIYISLELNELIKAQSIIDEVIEYAYKRDMRSSMYKLTYIKTQLNILQNTHCFSNDISESALLTLKQMIDIRGDNINKLKQEQYLIDDILLILLSDADGLNLDFEMDTEIQSFLSDIIEQIHHGHTSLHSYINLYNIDWPQI